MNFKLNPKKIFVRRIFVIVLNLHKLLCHGKQVFQYFFKTGLFLVVCILAIIVTHNALNKLIIQHNCEGSRRLFIASSPLNNRGLQSRWSGLQSSPRITFELGVRNNNAPASSSSQKRLATSQHNDE